MVRFIDEGPSTDGPASEGGGHARNGGADGSSATPAWGFARSRADIPAVGEGDAEAPSAYAPRFAPVWGVSSPGADASPASGSSLTSGSSDESATGLESGAGHESTAGPHSGSGTDAPPPTFAPMWGVTTEASAHSSVGDAGMSNTTEGDATVDGTSVDHASVDHVSVDHASVDHASVDQDTMDHASEGTVVPALGASVDAEPVVLAPVTALGSRRRARSVATPVEEDSAPGATPEDSGTAAESAPTRLAQAIVSDFATRASQTPAQDSVHPDDLEDGRAATPAPVAHGSASADTTRVAAFEEYPDSQIAALTRRTAPRTLPADIPLADIPEYIEGEDDEDDEDEEIVPPTFEEAVEHLVRRLARSALSRAEVIREAESIGLENDAAESVAERLDELGYLDDAVLAEQLKHSLYDRKGKSRQVVAREMAQRKIPAEIIEEALSEVADDDELAAATELAVKRVGQMSALDDTVADRRLSGFLARRGYPGSIVREAVRTALATRGRRGRITFR